MAPPRDKTLGLILAGGLARRMGGGDKALVSLAGRPLLAHVIGRLGPQCDALALNANGDPARFAAFGLPVLADDVPGYVGPLAGIHAGLAFAQAQGFAFVATVAVDTPFIPRDLVPRLHAARRETSAQIAVAASGEEQHHTIALWPAALAPAMHDWLEGGERAVHRFLSRCQTAVAAWPATPSDPFFNVNTPEEVAAAEAALAQAS